MRYELKYHQRLTFLLMKSRRMSSVKIKKGSNDKMKDKLVNLVVSLMSLRVQN